MGAGSVCGQIRGYRTFRFSVTVVLNPVGPLFYVRAAFLYNKIMDLKFLNLGKEKLRTRRLIDQWTPAVAFLFSFLKFLQFFKKIGGRVKESGWRTAMKAYSRMEHSKFILVAFRLTAYEGREGPPDLDETAERIVRRLARFFENVPELQWQLEWTAWHVTRKRKNLIDIVRARYRDDGSLESLRPYLDARGPGFDGLDAALT